MQQPTAATYDWVCQNTKMFEMQMVMGVIIVFFFYNFSSFRVFLGFIQPFSSDKVHFKFVMPFFSLFFCFCFVHLSRFSTFRILQTNEHWTKAGRFSCVFFLLFSFYAYVLFESLDVSLDSFFCSVRVRVCVVFLFSFFSICFICS